MQGIYNLEKLKQLILGMVVCAAGNIVINVSGDAVPLNAAGYIVQFVGYALQILALKETKAYSERLEKAYKYCLALAVIECAVITTAVIEAVFEISAHVGELILFAIMTGFLIVGGACLYANVAFCYNLIMGLADLMKGVGETGEEEKMRAFWYKYIWIAIGTLGCGLFLTMIFQMAGIFVLLFAFIAVIVLDIILLTKIYKTYTLVHGKEILINNSANVTDEIGI
ncbi:MAG: hypothetical protein ACI4LO_05110 [Anaerovoracaceae bacterium]